MAIRLVSLGGTDFVTGDYGFHIADLNDTINEMVRIIENGY